MVDLREYEEIDCPLCKGKGQYEGRDCPECRGDARMQRRFADQSTSVSTKKLIARSVTARDGAKGRIVPPVGATLAFIGAIWKASRFATIKVLTVRCAKGAGPTKEMIAPLAVARVKWNVDMHRT
jgi:hypothetical protein